MCSPILHCQTSCTIDDKWHSLPTVTPQRNVKCCESTRLIVKFPLPEAITGIKNTELFCPIQPCYNFFHFGSVGKCSCFMARFRSLGSKQIKSLVSPSASVDGLLTTSILDTQSVGWSTCLIMLTASISSNFLWTHSVIATGKLHGGCTTGLMDKSVIMWHFLFNFPRPSNTLSYSSSNGSVSVHWCMNLRHCQESLSNSFPARSL